LNRVYFPTFRDKVWKILIFEWILLLKIQTNCKNWAWKEKSVEHSMRSHIYIYIYIGNVFTLGPTAQATLVYIKTKLNSKNKPEKQKRNQSVNWCWKYLQVFRHLPGGPVLWPLATVVGNSILTKDLRILIKDSSLLSTDLDSGNCSCTKVITIILDRLSFAPRENLRTPATLLTREKKQKFHCDIA
jgi:hypothetical protein